MAYESKNLSALGYANGFTLWHYRTTDPDVGAEGYFSPASRMVRVGDFILVNAGIDSTPTHSVVVIATNAGGAVAVTTGATVGG